MNERSSSRLRLLAVSAPDTADSVEGAATPVTRPEAEEHRARTRLLPMSALLVPMSTLLAWRNLAHEMLRLVVTVVGIVFAVVLMSVLLSLLFGFASTTAGLIDHADADLWICARGTRNVDQAVDIPARWRHKALEHPDVIEAEKYITHFALLRRPDGGSESIILVGFNVDGRLGAPWNLVDGMVEDLKRPDAIIVDELYKEKLGITRVNQLIEINGHRARVVGFTRGVRTFVQSPYVFASFETAKRLGLMGEDLTTYVLLKLRPGIDVNGAKHWLRQRMPAAAVYDRAEFALSTQSYWLFATGAGMALILAAALGLIVGGVSAAQTLYASAMDHLPEYATLRAMGAPTGYLNGIIIKQALMTALLGYAIGISLTLVVVHASRDANTAMLLPWQVAIGLGLVTIVMRVLARPRTYPQVLTVNPA